MFALVKNPKNDHEPSDFPVRCQIPFKYKKMFVKNEEGDKNYMRFYVYNLWNIDNTIKEYGAL